MSVEIPSELQPLFECPSARDVLTMAEKLIRDKSKEEQRNLLSQTSFCNIVNSALFNLDQRRDPAAIKIVGAFDKEFQPSADKIFIGRSN